jgi:hypothetical protein
MNEKEEKRADIGTEKVHQGWKNVLMFKLRVIITKYSCFDVELVVCREDRKI